MTARSLDIIMALGAALALLLGGFAGFAEECDEIPSEVLRLHIPANSDSPRDQEIKLALRDCVLQEYGTQLSGARSREEAADNDLDFWFFKLKHLSPSFTGFKMLHSKLQNV